MGRTGLLVVCLLLSACTKHNPEACCTTTEDCAAKGLPDGTGCEDGYTCLNNTCLPPVACQAPSDCTQERPLCNTTTGTCASCLTVDDCAAGICDSESGECRGCAEDTECASGYCDLVTGNCGLNVTAWKYVPDACDVPSSTDWSITANATLDTTIDGNCHEIRAQAGGPEICVLHYRNVSSTNVATLRAKGTRALAIIVDQNFDWSGTLDMSANPSLTYMVVRESGPGGGWAVSGTHALITDGSAAKLDGGGGAGRATAGGAGGKQDPAVSNAGLALDIATINDLVGGARAASVPDPPGMFDQVIGGGGGGGLTVISCGGIIKFAGKLNASGAGGTRSTNVVGAATYTTGGSGGGAGGNVLFQGDNIVLTGSFLANGGGGGGGSTLGGASGSNGASPTFQYPCAGGGSGGGQLQLRGGDGGCDSQLPTDGGWESSNQYTAGGGGGSVGWFRTATRGSTPTVTPVFAQPAFSPNEMIGRR